MNLKKLCHIANFLNISLFFSLSLFIRIFMFSPAAVQQKKKKKKRRKKIEKRLFLANIKEIVKLSKFIAWLSFFFFFKFKPCNIFDEYITHRYKSKGVMVSISFNSDHDYFSICLLVCSCFNIIFVIFFLWL